MLDAFRPLRVSRDAEAVEDREYPASWLEPPSPGNPPIG